MYFIDSHGIAWAACEAYVSCDKEISFNQNFSGLQKDLKR